MDDDRTQEEMRGEEELVCALFMLAVDACCAAISACVPSPNFSMPPWFTL